MKRIILVSMYIIASIILYSCTDDTAETNLNNNKVRVVAHNSGDSSDPNNPTPPIKPQ